MQSPLAIAATRTSLLSLSDEALVALAASGTPAAFEALMRRHNRLLFRTARSILRNDEDAKDAVQEGYLRAWRSARTTPCFSVAA